MIGDRLKAERERLELTQPTFAEMAGAKKRTLIDWEKGVSSPTAVQLAALAKVGVDVLFILTGQRSQPVPATAELRPDQAALLDNYEHSDEVARQADQRLLDPRSQRKKA